MLPKTAEIQGELARRSLYEFVKLFWPVIEPGAPFTDGIHIRMICAALEAVTRGEITRLIITVPPRHGKSNLVSILWPAWVWATYPQRRWMFASYAQSLAERHSTASRRLIDSREYQERFGSEFALAADVNQKSRFENNKGGARFAIGIAGAATGEGGDVIVIDDAHNVTDAGSDPMRQATLDAFDYTLYNRLNDRRTGAIVIIGQRVHERDLVGHLLDGEEEWVHVCLPAEYDPNHPHLYTGDPRTTAGEPLWPERFPSEELTNIKARLGSYAAAAQLQQLPSPAGGGIFRRSYWRWYSLSDPPRNLEQVIISVDLAVNDATTSDYTVGQVWGRIGPDKYLLHQVRARLDFPAQLQMVRDLGDWVRANHPLHHPAGIYVERAANAHPLMRTLLQEIPGINLWPPMGSKEARALAVIPQIQSGNIYLPGAPDTVRETYDRDQTPEWTQKFVEETAAFPNGAHDDQVDACTQAITILDNPGFRIRSLN